MKGIILSIVSLCLLLSCMRLTPEEPITKVDAESLTPEEFLIKFDACFIKVAEHSYKHAKIPEIRPNPFFPLFPPRDAYIIHYNIKDSTLRLLIVAFRPYQGTREQFIENYPDKGFSFYGETIYGFDTYFVSEISVAKQREAVDQVYHCIDEITKKQ